MAVGPFEIVEKIGQGGMATVFKAYHAKLDRHVAIKVLHPAFRDDDSFLRRFGREARLVANLDHPHIVPIYDFAEHEGRPYLVMRYVHGITLKERHDQGQLSSEEVVSIVTAVSAALDYAHNKGILHRDIKPSNILLDRQGKAFLTDFGLARLTNIGETTISHDTIVGTPHYISPEQAKGLQNLDGRTDVYSFGVIVYQLLTGQVPFMSDTPYAVVHSHIFDKPPQPHRLNSAITPELEDVLLKVLAKSPNGRFPTAGIFADALLPFLTETPRLVEQALATPPPALPDIPDISELTSESSQTPTRQVPPPAPERLAQKRPFGRLLFSALLILLVIFASVFAIRQWRDNQAPIPTATVPAIVANDPTATPTSEPDIQPTPPATEPLPPATPITDRPQTVPTPDLTAVPTIQTLRSLSQIQFRDTASIDALYEEIAANPDNSALYIHLIAAYIANGNIQKARELIHVIFADARPAAYQHAAEELLAKEQMRFAMLVLADGVESHPRDIGLLQILMVTLIINDESDVAVQQLLRFSSDAPRGATIRHMGAAYFAYKDAQYTKALEELEAAQEGAPPVAQPNLLFLQGLVHIQLENSDAALAAFNEALTLNPPPWLKNRINSNIARLTDQ